MEGRPPGADPEPGSAQPWRERRYAFAHRLGEALVAQAPDSGNFTGPVVYGGWLNWGLLIRGSDYGWSATPARSPVGENHHLSNTIPPELWEKVVVITWPTSLSAMNPSRRLESARPTSRWSTSSRLRPGHLSSGARRRRDGGWRAVNHETSRSAGATAAGNVASLFGDPELAGCSISVKQQDWRPQSAGRATRSWPVGVKRGASQPLVRFADPLAARAAATTRSAPETGSSCSQMRTTVQPWFANVRSVSASRSRFPRTLSAQ